MQITSITNTDRLPSYSNSAPIQVEPNSAPTQQIFSDMTSALNAISAITALSSVTPVSPCIINAAYALEAHIRSQTN